MTDATRLPTPVTENWDWQTGGNCRRLDSAIFFHIDGLRGLVRQRREAQAKAICRTCPVLEACREHALEVKEPYGVWGGMGEAERRDIIKASKQGRRT